MNELQANHSEADILEGFREHFQALAISNDVPGFDKKYGDLVQDEIREIIDLGPVVKSIVSLTSSLRGQLIKCFMTLEPNTLIFFVEKMREAFASPIFSTKNIGIFEKLTSQNLTKH